MTLSEYWQTLAAVACAVLFVALSVYFSGPTAPSTSSEVWFTDQTSRGLHIVPASGGSAPSQPPMYAPQCTLDNTVTFSWGAVSGAEAYGARYNYSYIGCAAGWYSFAAYECAKDDIYSTSVSVPVVYNIGYNWWVHTFAGGVASGATPTWFSCPIPSPSCSLSVSPTTVNHPAAATLSWSSANADTFHITDLSYVTPNNSSGTNVAPSVTTVYTGTASDTQLIYDGSSIYWRTIQATCSATLTVRRSCTFNGATITHGNSVTAYQAATVPYGSSCASQTRTCTDGTLSGSYAYASCSVQDPVSCTLNGQTVAHGASRTFYSQQTTTGGQLCSSVSQSRTCNNGVLSGSASYQYANCSCAASYSCAGSSITYTNTSCSTSTIANCAAPSYCTPGLSSCQWSPIVFTPSGSLSGHLQARPSIVRTGEIARLYWDVENAASCTISGGGQTWNTDTSGAGGVETSPISERTTFTLSCEGGAANPDVNESVDVLIQPTFQEQ